MNRFKHANWWRSYLGELSKDFGHLQAWISSGNTSTNKGIAISQGKAKYLAKMQFSQGEFTHDAKIWHFASWVFFNSPCENFARYLLPCQIWQVTFYLAKFPLFLHTRTTDFPDIFSLIFSRVNSFCNLVFSRHKALSCNFAIYRGAQRLQKILGDRSSVH